METSAAMEVITRESAEADKVKQVVSVEEATASEEAAKVRLNDFVIVQAWVAWIESLCVCCEEENCIQLFQQGHYTLLSSKQASPLSFEYVC